MLLASYGIVFIIGMIAGIWLCRVFYKGEDMSVEQAIQLLKEKGYWVKINVNPKG